MIIHWLVTAGSLCLMILGGCDFATRQSTLDPKGPVAWSQYELFMVTVWVTLFIFIAVGGVLLWAVIRYRERAKDRGQPIPENGHGNPLVEVGLIGISILLLLIIAVPTVRGIYYCGDIPDDPESHLGQWFPGAMAEGEDNNVLVIVVRGYQWWWQFEYPQLGVTTANEFAIPVGKVVQLDLRAADVAHSFWLPKLAGKTDLIPGRANKMWLQADEPGHYYGQCAEFCGEAHAYMLFRANALEPAKFTEWIQHQKTPAKEPKGEMAILGKSLFLQKTCVQCHTIHGYDVALGVKGPDLTHVASRRSLAAGILDNADASGVIQPAEQRHNFFRWIKESQKIKPGNLMYHDPAGLQHVSLNNHEVDALVAYMQTLQ